MRKPTVHNEQRLEQYHDQLKFRHRRELIYRFEQGPPAMDIHFYWQHFLRQFWFLSREYHTHCYMSLLMVGREQGLELDQEQEDWKEGLRYRKRLDLPQGG